MLAPPREKYQWRGTLVSHFQLSLLELFHVLNERIGRFLQQIQFSDRKLIQLLEIIFDSIDNLSGGSLSEDERNMS